MSSITLQLHHSLPEIAGQWRDLEKSCGNQSIQNNFLVLNAWYKCYSQGRKPAFVSMREDDVCIGIYPFILERKFGIKSYNTLYKDAFSISKPIIREGFKETFYANLGTLLLACKSHWDVIKFSYIFCFDPEHEALASSLIAADANVVTLNDTTYTVKLDGTFEDYSAAYMSKKTVTDLRRLEKKIAGHQHNVVSYRDFEALHHMPRFYDMENTGWKKDAGTALMNASDYLVYTDSLVHNCSISNQFLMTFFELDGLKIAGQFGYFENGVYNLVRTSYDRDYSQYAPSVLLFLGTIRLLIDAFPDIHVVNYYPVSYGYKQKYSRNECACSTYVLFNNNLKGKSLSYLYKKKMGKA